MSDDLIETARRLCASRSKRPRQSDLKRAISTAYNALFHAVAQTNADRLIGVGANRADKAWRHTYRAMNHGEAKKACAQLQGLGFPADLVQVGLAFRSLQEDRHSADYDPFHRVSLQDARSAIREAETGIAKLRAASKKDQTAFAVQLLLKARTS
ncbi:hypothetical protein ACQKQD_32385 [Methylobacterium sp. NPDC080182]|uniref:hypothetical protein n=1 Tax=Methylobacterium sp. NPDC080182 TaxID=3390590 RepID=UPI003CFFF086